MSDDDWDDDDGDSFGETDWCDDCGGCFLVDEMNYLCDDERICEECRLDREDNAHE